MPKYKRLKKLDGLIFWSKSCGGSFTLRVEIRDQHFSWVPSRLGAISEFESDWLTHRVGLRWARERRRYHLEHPDQEGCAGCWPYVVEQLASGIW